VKTSKEWSLLRSAFLQDGYYFAELLLSKGYEVNGLHPRVVVLQHPAGAVHLPFHPRSPYSVSKVFAYRSDAELSRGRTTCSPATGLFNHESIRRGEMFVTRDLLGGGTQQGGPAGQAVPREPGRRARLGPRRVRGGDVDDAPAGRTGRFRDRDRGSTVREFVQLAFERVGLDW
jgi:GDPmannose 4,6-dehydratase